MSDCKHNNSLPVSACLLMEGERQRVTERMEGVLEEEVSQQNELKMKEQNKGEERK